MTETRAPVFAAMCIITTLLALFIVILRVGYRYARRSLIMADYMIIVAMFFSLSHFALDMTLVASYGYGKHEADLPPDLQNSYKTKIVYWVIQIVTKPPLLFAKLSLCLVYKNLLAGADHTLVRISRVLNYITLVVVVCFFTAVTLTSIFGCTPIQKNWFPSTPGTCINNLITVNYVTSSVNVVTSLLLIYIPLPVLLTTAQLRIEVKQLIALILLGLIDTIISIVRAWSISLFWNLNTDFTWIVIPTHTIIVVEYNITIVAASLVVMRPCFQAIYNVLFPKSIYSTNKSTIKLSDGYPGHSRSARVYSDPHASREPKKDNGIFKTVDIEMNTRSVSTEEILKAEDRF